MRRSVAVLIAGGLLVASCGTEDVAPARAGSTQSDLGSLVAVDAVAEPLQLPQIETRPPQPNPGPRHGPHPLTNREITEGELFFLLPGGDDLGDLAADFVLDDAFWETNTDIVRAAVQDRADEAGDLTAFGRVGGAHAVFRPRLLLTGDGPLYGIDMWVALFADDEGAAGYLDDFARDAAKGLGAGRPTGQVVLGEYAFAVDPIGDEAVGFILDLGSAESGELEVSETVVAFRVGRLLAFTSVTHVAGEDYRLRALSLTDMLLERTLGVLRGTIRLPEPEPEPIPLESYAFHFAQSVERGGVTAKVEADGVVLVPDEALSCDVTLTVGPSVTSHRYVVIDDQAWFDYGDDDRDGFFATPVDSKGVTQDLLYCPGWAVELDVSGLDRAIKWAQPSATNLDSAPAWTYRLGEPEMVAAGVLPPNSGIAIDYFTVSKSLDGPWLLRLDIVLSGRASAFVAAFGDEFGAGDRAPVEVSYQLVVTRINDPALTVTAPE